MSKKQKKIQYWGCQHCHKWLGPDTVDVDDDGNDIVDIEQDVTCEKCGAVSYFKELTPRSPGVYELYIKQRRRKHKDASNSS